MSLRRLSARNFRLLKSLNLELHPKLNFVTGENGAGKSTVLEAIHVLGRASSFRGSPSSLVSDGETAWALDAQFSSQGPAPEIAIRIRWLGQRVAVELNGRPTAISELVRTFPILTLSPSSHQLMEDGPGIRRRFIDWGVFHMERSFHPAWTRLNRSLRQRNSALRTHAKRSELIAWDGELVRAAIEITEMRQRYVDFLQSAMRPHCKELLGEGGWNLRFLPGWESGQDYAETLKRAYEADRKIGHTREGPHRAELQILSDNQHQKTRISRGQQKLLMAALALAQSDLYREKHAQAPLMLIDDFASELSAQSQSKLLHQLQRQPGQKVIAALDYNELLRGVQEHVMFHVEHGQVSPKTE